MLTKRLFNTLQRLSLYDKEADVPEARSHKIEIRQRAGKTGIMTGANTEVLLDGKNLKFVTSASFKVDAEGVAKVTLEMVGDVVVTGVIGDLNQVFIPLKK